MSSFAFRVSVGVLIAGLGFIDVFVLESVDEMLKSAQSEIRPENIGSWLDDLTPAGSSNGIRSTEETASIVDSSATRTVDATRTPDQRVTHAISRPAPVTATGEGRKSRVWWGRLLRQFVPQLFRAGDNRSFNTFTASSHQAALTIENFNASAVKNDPVLPHSGEMTFSHPILHVPGIGYDFSLSLGYRSGIGYDGPVGKKWEHNWNARFVYIDSNTIARYAGGREDLYNHAGSGVYDSPAGQFEKSVTLVSGNVDNVIIRHLQDGTVETYRDTPATMQNFLLESVEHATADNNRIELFYDDGNDYRLTRIRDTRAKDFVFTYDGNARISQIQDFSSGGMTPDREWSLGYDGSGNLLTCTLPNVGSARTFAFGYDGSNRLTTVTAPREYNDNITGHLQMWYDSSTSKVTKQRFGASGAEYTLAHDTSAHTMLEVDREGTSRIYYYDASDRAVTRIRVVVGASNHDTDYAWNGTSALLEKVTYPEGNGVRYVYDEGRLLTMAQCTSAGLAGTISRASADFLVTSYGYDTTSNWTLMDEVTDPEGNTWVMTRDTDGNVLTYATPEHPLTPWVFEYDGSRRVTLSEDPIGRVSSYLYGATGMLTQVKQDPSSLDLQTTLYRDAFENVTKVKDPAGGESTFARNLLGYVTKVTTAEGHETDYTYDRNDLVVEVLSDNSNADMPNTRHKVTVAYNVLDIVTEVREYYGASHASYRAWTYAYDKEDRLTLTTLPESARQVKMVYDARGLQTTRTVAFGTADATSMTYAYDANHRMTASVDGLNNDTEIVYDAFDRAIRVNDAENHYRTTAYDKNGNVTLVRAYKSDNTKLTETTLAYDDDNLMTSQSQWAKKADLSTNIGSGAIVSTLEYDTSGLLITKADPCGCGGSGTTVMLYDAAGRLVTVKDHSPTTYQTDLLLDANGRTTQIEQDEIDGGTTRTYVVKRTYNADGHLTKIEEKGGGGATALTTNLLVDARGRVRKVTDPNGNETYFKMDDFGRVVQTDQMLTVSTKIEMRVVYDLNNNVLQKILERGATDGVVEYVYDNADRLVTSKDEGATHHATYIYDAASNVSRFTDRNGSVVTFSYDKLNQMTLQSASLGSGVVGPTTTKYYYDALGRSISAFNGDAKVSRTFNTLSRLESETTWVTPASEASPGISSKTISYDYDGDGKLSLTHYPDSTTVVKRTYDTLGRVTKIERKRGGGSFNTVATWAFQGPSKMKTLEWGNRTKESMVYDAYGRATLMTHERQTGASTWVDMYDYERGYDAASRPTFERREYRKSSDGNLLTGRRDFGDLFAYDAVNRITAVVEGVGYQTGSHSAVTSASLTTIDFVNRAEYTFDEAGNRQTLLRYDSNGTVSKQSEREDHTFDIENQLGTRKEWFYDSGTSGLTLRNTITYTHDNAGSQTSSSGGGIGAVSVDLAGRIYEAGDWVYRYDPFGRRVEKRDTQGGGFHRWYFYDGVTCVEEYGPCEDHGDIDNCSTPDPIWQRVYGPYLTDQILWGEYDADGDRTTTNTPMFFHLDFIGSVVMVTDDTGTSSYATILESYRYDSYGTPTFRDGDGGARSSSAYEQDKLYTGRRFDPELGTYYYRARTLSSTTGAFVSRDPIWTWGSLYSYVGNRPIDRIDPMGEQGVAVVGLDHLPPGINVLQGPFTEHVGSTLSVGPLDARAGYIISGFVEDFIMPIQGGGANSNGPMNALQHCYWTCMMEVRSPGQGWPIAQIHEGINAGAFGRRLQIARGITPQPNRIIPGDHFPFVSELAVDDVGSIQMDWHNNGKGRWCAEDIRKRGGSVFDCLECCRKRLFAGQLVFELEVGGGGITPRPIPPTGDPVGGGGGSSPVKPPKFDNGNLVGVSSCGKLATRTPKYLKEDSARLSLPLESAFWNRWKLAFEVGLGRIK